MPKSFSNWDEEFYREKGSVSPTKKLAALTSYDGLGIDMEKPLPLLPKQLKITERPVECAIKTIVFK